MAEVYLGAGEIYMVALAANSNEVPTTLFTDTNKIGVTFGGASVDYKATIKEIEDDEGNVKMSAITKQEATLKCGLAELDGEKIVKSAGVGTYTAASGTGDNATPSSLTIGGETENVYYAIGFKHATKDIKVSIIGTNKDGIALNFDKENETKIEPTFSARKDSGGKLLTIEGI